MPLTDAPNEGAISKVQEEAAKAQAVLENMVSFYEGLSGNEVPVSIKEALDHDWHAALTDSAKELLEYYPTEKQKQDRKRVIRAEVAAKILLDFEQEMVGVTVSDYASIVSSSYKRTARVFEFILRDYWKVTSAVFTFIYDFRRILFEALKKGVWEEVKYILRGGNPVIAVIRLAYANYKLVLAAASAIFMVTMLAKMVKEINEAFNQVKFKAGVKPVMIARAACEVKLREAALSQGSGRVRRRKKGRG